jgi:membrane protease YdiL (CAAX protease family)
MTSVRPDAGLRGPIAFFVLAFAISWALLAWTLGPGAFPAPAEQLQSVGAGLAILAGPSLAALLVIAVTEGAAGLRNLAADLRRWRVRPGWYAFALLVAPLLSVAVSLGLSLGSRSFLPAVATSDAPGALVGTALASALMIGLAEELGWTGYAVRRLLRRCGVQVTGLVVGLAWGVWHVPLFWEASSFLSALGLGLLLARLVSWLPPFRLLMVWVYDRTESLLVVVLMHVSLVVSTLLFQPAIAGAQLLVFILVWAAALWSVAVVVVVWDRSRPPRTTGRRPVA